MEARGFRATDMSTVIRYTRRGQQVRLAKLLEFFFPTVSAETYYPGEGEVVITDYDDGNAQPPGCNLAGWPYTPVYWQCLGLTCGIQIGAYILDELDEGQRVCKCGYAGGLSCV
jgi:hypothetical protein